MSDAIKSIASLKSLLTNTKVVVAEYPGHPEFKINLTFLSREDLVNMRKKSTVTTIKRNVTTEVFNDELFLKLYTQGAVKGWSGLKLSTLTQLAPVDLTGQDMQAELEFSEENALYLMQKSTEFDAFISDTVTDLANFQ